MTEPPSISEVLKQLFSGKNNPLAETAKELKRDVVTTATELVRDIAQQTQQEPFIETTIEGKKTIDGIEQKDSSSLSRDETWAIVKEVFPRLFKFQDKYERIILDKILKEKKPAVMMIAATGLGKTYILAKLIQDLQLAGWFNKFGPSLVKVLFVTKASVVTQSERVLKEFGLSVSSGKTLGTDVFVTNYDQLHATLGELMIRDYTVIERGEPIIKFEWKPFVTPILVIWDECHALMNEGSIQSKIAQALNDLPPDRQGQVTQIFSSATPLGRVCEGKCFAVATRIPYKYGFITSPLTNKHWLDYASAIAYPTDYREHSPSAVGRLITALDDFIVSVKGARPKYHARNGCLLIDFQTNREREIYNIAFEEYQETLRAKGRNELEGLAKIWVAMLKFRQVAELLRAPYLARAMFESVRAGKAAVMAGCFRATIARCVEILVNDYGVSRDEISLIWGGISDVSELKEEFQDLDLGPQSRKQRQEEIDKFQAGKSLYCFFTFKAGGAGLSLHHDKEGLRPREVYLTPLYNAKELVQGLGRCPRLTSLSDTVQTIIYYRGTEEEKVAEKVNIKLRCLKEVVRQKESWFDVFDKSSVAVWGKGIVPMDADDNEEPEGMYIEDEKNNTEEVIDI